MLRRDANARFEKTGPAFFARYRFVAGGVEAKRALTGAAYGRLQRRQRETPVRVLFDADRGRSWWLFREAAYWEDDGFDEDVVKALLLQREVQGERHVRRAVALSQQEALPSESLRPPIADDVKLFVWQRDSGRCVACGGRERLEFDHVIPLAMGGGNTARNLQILCEACNRTKGAALT